MSYKQAVLKREKSPLVFFFPSTFPDTVISDSVRSIRVGERQNWRREFRELEVEVTVAENLDLEEENKFVVIGDQKGAVMVIFPKEIYHSYMAEVVQHATFDLDVVVGHRVLAAGFVIGEGSCGGFSETLGVGSRKAEDNKLFKETFK